MSRSKKARPARSAMARNPPEDSSPANDTPEALAGSTIANWQAQIAAALRDAIVKRHKRPEK